VLDTGATVSDTVQIVAYDVFSVADTVSASDGGSFGGNVGVGGNLSATGTLAVTGNSTFSGDIIKSTSGTSNFAAGVNAGNSIVSGGNYNTVVGDEAGTAITTGDNNTALGYQAGDALTTPFGNVAIGDRALSSETTGQRNTAVGSTALFAQNNTGNELTYNTAVGYQAGGNVTTGVENTFIGANAGDASTEDDHNTFVGYNAGGLVNGGFRNTFIGKSAGDAMTTGDKNIIIGTYNGNESDLGDIRTLSNYIVLSDGDGNSRVWVTGGSNVNQFFATGIYLWTTSASANVVVTGSSGHIARSTSALKYKQDIRDLEDIDIDKFRPIRYKSASAIDDQTIDHFGFIADEVHDAGITELVSYGDDDKVEGFQYERMTAVLVKTLQEQKKTIKALTDRITALESK
jgi:hypothetical protein